MTAWKQLLTRLVAGAESGFDRAKYAMAGVRGPGRPVVVTYRSYGTRDRLTVRGRVLQAKRIPEASADDPWWRNLRSALSRLESDEVPGARVRVRAGGSAVEAVADGEGYVTVVVEPVVPLSGDRVWHDAEVELVEPPPAGGSGPFVAPVLVPGEDARFGVISDLDDTVIRTGATDPLAVVRHTLFGNVHTRLPYPGVAAFYRALAAGRDGEARNAFFYVSSTPWNLYDVVLDVLRLHAIPLGAVLLRDWGVTATELLPTTHGRHKRVLIEGILDTYPSLPFLLIGDSGQEDPEIYREMVRANPGRVLAVYIRDVAGRPRAAAVRRMGEDIEAAGASFVLAEDTGAAARHAADRGWIPGAAVAEVERGCLGEGGG